MRCCRLPRSNDSRHSGWPKAAVAAALAILVWPAAGHAQSNQDGERFAVPTVDPEVTAPLSGFRRQIDPDSQRDPFAEDRAAERERDRRGDDVEGDPRFQAGDADGLLDPLQDPNDPQTADGAGDNLPVREPNLMAEDARSGEEALVQRTAEEAADTLTGPYDPIGVRIGSFLLFPELTTGTLYTDNVLITTRDPISDHALYLTPKLKAQSNWSRHYFEANLGADQSYYSEYDIQNDNSYNIDLLGRLDVTRRTQIEGTFEHERTLEDIDSVSAVQGAADRTPIITTGGSTELKHRFNRLTASLRGGITEFDYEDVRLIEGGIANNDDRDYTERKLTGRLSYEFNPEMTVFVESSTNTHKYVQRIDDNGIVRGSDGGEVLAGVAVDLASKLRGELAAGYARQTPDEQTFDDIAGFVFNGVLTWEPTALTTVRFEAGSNIQETTLVDSPGSLVRNAELSIEHALRQNIIAGISLGYVEEAYEGIDQVDTDYIFGLNGEYLFNRSVALGASYEHINSTSNVPDSDTVENIFRVGMRLRR